jgi:hypothetical protein
MLKAKNIVIYTPRDDEKREKIEKIKTTSKIKIRKLNFSAVEDESILSS